MLLYEYMKNSLKFNCIVLVVQGGAEEREHLVEFAQPSVSI